MKNLILLVLILFCCQFKSARAQQDGAIDDVGGIAFIAWSSSNQDGYAFVLLDDCPNGTTIKFIDEEWTDSAFYSSSGEGENTWTNNTGNTIKKGQVIVVESAENNPTCNIGSVSESDAGFDIASSSPDQIFAIVGSRASPKFLAMIGHVSLPNNGTGAIQTLNGTGLTNGTSAIHFTSESLYDGSTSCNSNISSCLQMIHNSSNWETLTSSIQFPQDVDTLFDGTVLPVSLLSFMCISENGIVKLRWATVMETNNAGFDIQRKTNQSEWIFIDFTPGVGNSSERHDYEVVDSSIIQGQTYFYRLKQTDYDGTTSFSKVVKSVSSNNQDKQHVKHWIEGSRVRIKSTDDLIMRVEIFNAHGQQIEVLEPKSIETCFQPPIDIVAIYYVQIYLQRGREILKVLYLPEV